MSRPVAGFARWAWIVFVVFAALGFVFGVFPGTWFDSETDDTDSRLLVTTYAAVAVGLTLAVALTAFRRGERWAWLAFWLWPAFFVVHGIAFFVVDFVFAAVGIAALFVTASRPQAADRPI